MNSRHLFRGKIIESGKWITGYFGKYKTEYLITIEDGAWQGVTGTFLTGYPVDPDTIGQCTGLPDLRGDMIYDGDRIRIVRNELKLHPDVGEQGVIRFGHYKHSDASIDYICGDYGFYIEWDTDKLLRNDLMYWQGNNYIEIIGNIHDKELTK